MEQIYGWTHKGSFFLVHCLDWWEHGVNYSAQTRLSNIEGRTSAHCHCQWAEEQFSSMRLAMSWPGCREPMYGDGNCHLWARRKMLMRLHVLQPLHPAILSQANLRSPKIWVMRPKYAGYALPAKKAGAVSEMWGFSHRSLNFRRRRQRQHCLTLGSKRLNCSPRSSSYDIACKWAARSGAS